MIGPLGIVSDAILVTKNPICKTMKMHAIQSNRREWSRDTRFGDAVSAPNLLPIKVAPNLMAKCKSIGKLPAEPSLVALSSHHFVPTGTVAVPIAQSLPNGIRR